ncbi:MAG: DUF2809 domain-containing protein [Verrucomicrobiae bacterium]|nr:DUF2809 domain-containing protein [Verrucomicrobiae bacterium]
MNSSIAERLVARRDRSRIVCILLIGVIIPMGLATRSLPWLPEFVRSEAGDALWAAMVYWGFALVFPQMPVWAVAACAAAFSLGIELSQLSSHPLLVQARSTRLGALVLGHGFLWIDLLRYAVGVALAVVLDLAVVRIQQALLKKDIDLPRRREGSKT